MPTPPPFSGPEINGELLLKYGLGPAFRLCYLRTNVNESNSTKGRFSLRKVGRVLHMWLRLVATMGTVRPRIVYLFLSQNRSGFVRDAMIILTGWALGAQIVAHLRGGNFGNFYAHAGWLLRLAIRLVLGRVGRIIVLAERLRPQFSGLVPQDRIRVIPNGVDIEMFGDRDGNRRARRTAEPFIILYVGHLSEAKGFGDLLAAAAEVLDAVPESLFVFAGEWLKAENNVFFGESGERLPCDVERLRDCLSRLRLRYGDRVRQIGVVTGAEKADLFRAADMVVLPSYSEGFPMVVLEAMAASLPLVATRVGALPEVLQEDVHVKFLEPGDRAELTRALIDMARAPEARVRMGSANRALVETRFNISVVNERLSEILRECVDD